MSLRLRLTALYVLLLAFALAAFGVVFYLVANHRLYNGVDDSLTVRSQTVKSDFEPLTSPLTQEVIQAKRRELDSEAAAGSIFQIRGADGTLLYSSFPGSGGASAPQGGAGKETFFTRKINGEELRLLDERLVNGEQSLGSVQVAQPLRETDEALTEIRDILIAGGLLAIILTSVPTYLVAGVFLRPLRELSELAREVERTADFSRRLALSGPTGETRELVSTINSMIGRVERSLVAQQAFLADSSHELRRPLTVIRANVEMLFDPALPKDQREQCLTAIQEESQAMSRLIADLLLLSREKSQTISQGLVNYSAVCEAGAQRLSARDRGRHQLEVDISPGLYVLGDRERLSQLVDNLLDNAARYTAPNGRIELHAAARDGHARLTVQDTGIGIPQDEIPHVFDRFFRGIDARVLERDGSGLGLAIVKYVTEAHGGLVQVSSEPGQGTAVLVELPAVKVDQS